MLNAVRKLAPDWLTLLSAVLIVFSFPPWNVYPLIWIALIPWFFALARAPSSRAAFKEGVWLSFFMTLGGFYWVASVLQEFGNLPWTVAVVGLLLFALIGQPQFLLFAPIWRMARRPLSESTPDLRPSGLWLAISIALSYAGLDWILPKLFVDTLGHSMYLARHLRQAADLGGATLLTFVIFLVNDSFYKLIRQVRTRAEPSLLPALRLAGFPALVALLLSLGLWIYGYHRYAEVVEAETHARQSLQAAVIQANIGDFDKIAAERGISGAADKVIETFFEMSDRALALSPRPQVLIWPETSYPSTFRTPSTAEELARDQKVEHFVHTRKIPLLFGGYDHADNKDFNAFFFLSPQAGGGVDVTSDLQIYRKNVLLLFGEFIPGAEQFNFIKNAFPQVGNFGRGVGPSVLRIETGPKSADAVRAGPIICYEALFPNYVIDAARKGSQMILNITNDSWFGPHGEPELHLSLTTFRSIETRLPQLRSTNTGISALILPDGEITYATSVGKADILNVKVPLMAPLQTLMLKWGDWFGPAAMLVGWLGLLVGLVLSRRNIPKAP